MLLFLFVNVLFLRPVKDTDNQSQCPSRGEYTSQCTSSFRSRSPPGRSPVPPLHPFATWRHSTSRSTIHSFMFRLVSEFLFYFSSPGFSHASSHRSTNLWFLLIIVAVFAGRFAAASLVVFAVTKGDGGGRFWLPKLTPQCTVIVNVFVYQKKKINTFKEIPSYHLSLSLSLLL